MMVVARLLATARRRPMLRSRGSGVTKRRIISAGCPNHESYCGQPANKPTWREGLKGGTEATDWDLDVDVPRTKLLDADDWAAVLADAATVLPLPPPRAAPARSTARWAASSALNGVVFYSGAVGNKLNDPPCPSSASVTTRPGGSADCCGGRARHRGYHYFPPSCLIAQANKTRPSVTVIVHRSATTASSIYRPQTAPAASKFATAAFGAHPTLPDRRRLRGRARASTTTSIGITSPANPFKPELAAVLPKPDDLDLYFPFTLRHSGVTLAR